MQSDAGAWLSIVSCFRLKAGSPYAYLTPTDSARETVCLGVLDLYSLNRTTSTFPLHIWFQRNTFPSLFSISAILFRLRNLKSQRQTNELL